MALPSLRAIFNLHSLLNSTYYLYNNTFCISITYLCDNIFRPTPSKRNMLKSQAKTIGISQQETFTSVSLKLMESRSESGIGQSRRFRDAPFLPLICHVEGTAADTEIQAEISFQGLFCRYCFYEMSESTCLLILCWRSSIQIDPCRLVHVCSAGEWQILSESWKRQYISVPTPAARSSSPNSDSSSIRHSRATIISSAFGGNAFRRLWMPQLNIDCPQFCRDRERSLPLPFFFRPACFSRQKSPASALTRVIVDARLPPLPRLSISAIWMAWNLQSCAIHALLQTSRVSRETLDRRIYSHASIFI